MTAFTRRCIVAASRTLGGCRVLLCCSRWRGGAGSLGAIARNERGQKFRRRCMRLGRCQWQATCITERIQVASCRPPRDAACTRN